MATKTRKRLLRPNLITLAVASCFASNVALANPTSPVVVHGSASFAQSGSLLTVTNSPSTIINWESFSIGASEITRFLQQSAASAVLNRVTTQNPSAILGALQSNGRVFLINPNGIAFGASAQIDVAGLVASTLGLSNEDFLAGRMRFTEVPGAGAITNDGAIRTASGGSVYLVGSDVTNSGVITSPQGEVVLAAGNSVELVNPATPNLRVQVAAAEHEARNLGTIVADAGRIGIYAGLVTQGGTVQANGATVTDDGRIVLKATQNVALEAGSVTTANGANGGTVEISSGDTTLIAGTVEAKGTAGKGGTVHALGDKVGLIDGAAIDASGATGGGTVLVGGDFQGSNPDIQNASRTYVGADTTIRADATDNGDGGKVIVWSDEATRVHGTISAQGGAQGGDGGFVETSGKEGLDVNDVRVDASAPARAAGTWLLDPKNIEVRINGTAPLTEVDAFADLPTSSLIIAPAAINGSSANVVLQADNDLTFTDAVSVAAAGISLTGQAGRAIAVNADITTNNADITLTANDAAAPGTNRDAGAGGITMAPGTTIKAGSGKATLTVGTFGDGTTGGSIIVENIVATDIELQQNGMTFGSSILRASNASLLQGTNLLMEIDFTSGGSIGTSASPMRVQVSNLEAHTHQSSSGIFIDSPNQGLTIGGVPFFAGSVKGVQNETSGDISISSNGDLTLLAGTAGCGFTGGTGGPVCANGSDINLSATGNITINNVVNADGGEGNSALVSIQTSGGNLTVSKDVTALGGSSGGAATVNLNAAAGQVLVNNDAQVAAVGGFNFSAPGGAATASLSGASVVIDGVETTVQATGGGVSGFASGGAASTTLTATSSPVQVINGATVSASGGGGGTNGGAALVKLTGPSITVNNSTVAATGGAGSNGGDATVELNASAGNVDVASTISATGGNPVEGLKGEATVSISATNGNVTTRANIIADGAEGTISISALDGFIQQTDPAGFLKAVPSFSFSSGFGTVNLTAKNGIGTIANPIRIDNTGDPDVSLQNLGTTGDIAVSFFNQAFNETCGASIHLCIDGDFTGTFNNNPTGTYYVRSETGDLRLDIAATPDEKPLLDGQNVHLAAPSNSVILTGAATGSIAAGTSGSVTLEAGNLLDLQPGSSVSGGNVLLKADNMNIFGTVTATPGATTILPFTSNRPIKLGPTLQSTSELMLSRAELEKILGGAMVIGSQSGGLLTFESAIDATALSSSLEVRGSSVVQAPGATITGALAAFGVNAVNLADASNQISSFTGGTQGAGAALGVFTQSALQINSITTQNGPVTVTADGNISFTFGGSGINAGTGSATLSSTGGAILDGHTGVDIVANQALFTAASGIGSFADAIEIQVAGVSLTSTAGEVGVSNTGNLVLNGLAFSGSTASVEASGTLSLGSSISVAGASNIGLRGTSGLTVDQSISASNGGVTLESGAGTDVTFTGSGGVNTLGGGIAVTSGRDIVYGSSSQINSSSGSILLTAGNDAIFNTQRINSSSGNVLIQAGRDYVHISTSGHNNSSGSFSIHAARDLSFNSGRINNSSGAIALMAGNNLTYNGSNNLNTSSGNISVAAGQDMSFTQQINSSIGAISVAAGGNFAYGASSKINTFTGNISISAGGNATFVNGGINTSGGAVNVSTGGNLNLLAAASPVEFRTTSTGASQSYTVGGNLNLQGGSGSGARAQIEGGGFDTTQTFNVTGNVNLTGGTGPSAYARIFNDPDVNMTVGGTVNLQAGSGTGAFAAIEAGSIETINLTFPTLASGGFFVNGVENVVFDEPTSTGFLAEGEPAVLGVNFLVTYGGAGDTSTVPLSVEQAINQVVNATNQQATEAQPEPGGETTTTATEDEEEKKSLPVCS